MFNPSSIQRGRRSRPHGVTAKGEDHATQTVPSTERLKVVEAWPLGVHRNHLRQDRGGTEGVLVAGVETPSREVLGSSPDVRSQSTWRRLRARRP